MTSYLPIVPDSDEMAEKGRRMVEGAVAQTGHIFRPTERRDFGIDGQIEIVMDGDGNRHATGQLVAVQIKCGPSYLTNPYDGGYIHYCSSAHANYWLGHSLPVIVILCDPAKKECYWVLVDSTTLTRTPTAAKIAVPVANTLSASGPRLSAIAEAGKPRTLLGSARAFVFPLNARYDIDLSDEELQALCGEAALAFSRSENVMVDVHFALEELVAAEVEQLERLNNLTPADRTRVVELGTMQEWFSAKRRHLARGLKLLLSQARLRAGYVDVMQFDAMAKFARSFLHYYIYERISRDISDTLVLNAFPGSGDSDAPVAAIYLDDPDRQAFLQMHNLGESPVPMRWPGYVFGDLGHDLAIRRGLPAVVTAILFYADRQELSDDDIRNGAIPWLSDWQLRAG